MRKALYALPVLAVLAILPAAHIAFGTVEDLAGNYNAFENNIPVSLREPPGPPNTTPPTMVSATIDSDSQTLTVLFDEPVVVDPGASVVFLFNNTDAIRGTLTVESTRITVALTEEEVDGYGDGDSVTVIPGTVLDLNGNGVVLHRVDIELPDTTPPRIVSGTYETATGRLTIVFSET